MYVDLGRPYKIDHIEVVAYMPTNCYRSSNYDIIVTNTIPDLTPYNASNPGTDVLVANVGVMNDAVNNISGKKTYYLPDDIGEKQVVSFEKLGSDTQGLLIQEVRVYVEQSNVKPMPTNVALNKTGYTYPGTINGYPASSVTNGIIYNNGNDTCIVGFTPSLYWVDLGAEYDISKVRIHAYRADATYDYTTYLSAYLSATPPTSDSVDIPSGATTIIADPGDVSWATPDKTVILDSSVKARYLIVKRSNHSKGIAASNDLVRLCLSEVEVYGTLAE